MTHPRVPLTRTQEQLAAAIRGWQTEVPGPLVVAIDGHGAAGKTTLAHAVMIALDAKLVSTDDYFQEDHETGDPRPMGRYYAWHALRKEALEPSIRWLREVPDAWPTPPLILVEGVSAAAPALADLVDRAVLVQTPEPLRLERLHARVSDEEWDEQWLDAEREYFATRPPASFDLVVDGAD